MYDIRWGIVNYTINGVEYEKNNNTMLKYVLCLNIVK